MALTPIPLLGLRNPITIEERGKRDTSSQIALAAFVRISSGPIPRVARMMTVAVDHGFQPAFIGARREIGLPSEEFWDGWRVLRAGPYFPLVNGKRPFRYVSGICAFNLSVARTLLRMRPVLIHISDAEPFAAGWLVARLTGARLLYNIHDNLAQRYALPRFLQFILNALEGVFVLLSDATIVPEQFRKDALPRWSHGKITVVRNTPIDPGVAPPPQDIDRPITIFFGGWLDYGRGLGQLVELAARNPYLKLRIAGEGSPEVVARIRDAPNVTYLGFVTHAEILRESAAADFIAALYDPRRIINRYAASNKIAEALAVGRPVIVNREIEVARYLAAHGCSIQTGYDQVDQLAPELLRIARDRDQYIEMCASARRAYDADYSWSIIRTTISNVLDRVANNARHIRVPHDSSSLS